MTVLARSSPALVLTALAGVYGIAIVVATQLEQLPSPSLLAVALTLDLVVLAPVIFYVAVIRSQGWDRITLVPVLLISFGLAFWLLPPEHHGLVVILLVAIPVAEVALGGFVGVRLLKAVWKNRALGNEAGLDFYDRLRAILTDALPSPAVAGAVAYEIALLYYLIRAQQAGRSEPQEHHFAVHRRDGYGAVVIAILISACVELAALHFILLQWSTTAAWIHFALVVYGMAWLVGDYRAIRSRSIVATPEILSVRVGIRWQLDIPWSEVVRIARYTGAEVPKGSHVLNATPAGSARYVVRVRNPVVAIGPYGIRRHVTDVYLTVDDVEAFEAEARRRVGGGRAGENRVAAD